MQTHYKQLTDSQWQVMKTSLPIQSAPKVQGTPLEDPLERKRKHNLRNVVDGIFWMLRTGSQWRNLPEKFPKWQLVYYYFRKWQRNGVMRSLTWKLNALFRHQKSKEPTPSALSIDSQSVKSEGVSQGVPWTFGESTFCSRADGN